MFDFAFDRVFMSKKPRRKVGRRLEMTVAEEINEIAESPHIGLMRFVARFKGNLV